MQHESPQPGTLETGTGQLVMLVDDDSHVREASERILKRLGYRVAGFGCPLEALEAFRREPASFALLITDLSMPEMSGDELTRRVRAVRSDVPVVVCSGYRPEDAPDSVSFERCSTITKPFTLLELRATVVAALKCELPA